MASGVAIGVNGSDVSAFLNLTGTTHTAVGDYPADPWTFTSTNYNDASGTVHDHIAGFLPAGSMGTARSFHTAILLTNGKVLVSGGLDTKGAPLASAEVYDPVAKTFSPTSGNMPNKAAGHTATLLLSGKVLVVGGGNSSSEIYDPVTNSWSSAGGISGQRTYHTATLLPTGKVLIAGGSDQSGKTMNTAMLYDPATGSYASTGSMSVGRDFHTAALLPNGKVLIAGGRTSSGPGYVYQAGGELYDPATGVFTVLTGTGSAMSSQRYGHSAILFNGKVLIGGGANTAAVATVDVFDPASGKFAPAGSLATARQYFAVMPFGGVVIAAGGLNGANRLSSAEQYQGSFFAGAGNMTAPRAAHTATVLSDGTVLVTGGQGSTGVSVATAERLQ
jgi:WD40 repeat protein